MKLECFVQDQVELVIDTTDGYAFATQRGYARMSGISRQSIINRQKQYISTNKAEVVDYSYYSDSNTDDIKKNLWSNLKQNNKLVILTNVPVQFEDQVRRVTLYGEELISDWIVDDNPEIAKQLMRLGVRMFLHQLAGYKVISTAVQPLDNTQEMLCKMMTMIQQISEENKQIVENNKQMQQDIAELKETKMKYDNIQTNVSFRFDNLFLTLRQYEYEELTQKLLESAQGTPFTVKDWLDGKRINLDRGTKTKFGRLVADSYKAMVGREPDTKGNSNTRLYFDKDKDLLQMCFRQLMGN